MQLGTDEMHDVLQRTWNL